jgi:uncharacterized repeat protein (TIGR04076 family)
MLYKLKITVLKTDFDADIADEYRNPQAHYGPCNIFEAGQEIEVEKWWEIPEGFCEWAWIDIQKPLFALATGAQLDPWMKDPNTWIACCTDGVKPVTFKIERIMPPSEEDL